MERAIGITRNGRVVWALWGAEGEGAGGSGGSGGAGGAAGSATGGEGAGATGTTATEEPFDKDRAMSTIKAQRESENRLKAELAEANKKIKAHEDEKLSAQEKADKRAADAERERDSTRTELQGERLKNSVFAVAASSGARYPDDVWKLISLSEVDYDSEGRPTNVKKLVEQVRKDRPDYFKPGTGAGRVDAGATGTATGGEVDMNQRIRRAAGRR